MTISEAVRTRVHTPFRAAKLLRLAASWTLAAQLTGAPAVFAESDKLASKTPVIETASPWSGCGTSVVAP